MRYAEIIGEAPGLASNAARKSEKVWKATQKKHEALRKLRSKQQAAHDAMASARALEPGPEKVRRMRSAQAKDADARRGYGDALRSANGAIRNALSSR